MSRTSVVESLGDKIRLFFWKVGAIFVLFFVFRLRIYSLWSRLYQRIFHNRFSNPESALYVPLSEELLPQQAQNLMNLVRWTADGPRELWDAIGSPHWFQHILRTLQEGGKQPSGAVDCDEYSVWAANTVARNFKPHVLSVSWISEVPTQKRLSFKGGGHNVCICEGEREGRKFYFHIGNWGRSRNFDRIEGVIVDILVRGNRHKNHLAGWALWTPDLKLVATSRKHEDAKELELN